MRTRIVIAALIALPCILCTSPARAASDFTYLTLTHPQADTLPIGIGTRAYGNNGSLIVGSYERTGVIHAFTFNGTNYTTLDHPHAVGETQAYGIDGTTIVGAYKDALSKDHGYIYNGTTFTPVDHPLGVNGTIAYGIARSSAPSSTAAATMFHTFTTARRSRPHRRQWWGRSGIGSSMTSRELASSRTRS
jgi:hypothetical protein